MREILFRAKRVDNGEWVSGGSVIQFLDNGVRSFYMPQFNEKCVCEHDEATDDILKIENVRFYKVDSESICQYTGLTDKNGKKIWENDILRYSYDYEDSPWLKEKGLTNEDIKYYIGAVFWSDWRASWAVCGKGKSRGCNQNVFTYSRNPNRTEVIGNVFDNPELLED